MEFFSSVGSYPTEEYCPGQALRSLRLVKLTSDLCLSVLWLLAIISGYLHLLGFEFGFGQIRRDLIEAGLDPAQGNLD